MRRLTLTCLLLLCCCIYVHTKATLTAKRRTLELKYVLPGMRSKLTPERKEKVHNVTACHEICLLDEKCVGYDYCGRACYRLYDLEVCSGNQADAICVQYGAGACRDSLVEEYKHVRANNNELDVVTEANIPDLEFKTPEGKSWTFNKDQVTDAPNTNHIVPAGGVPSELLGLLGLNSNIQIHVHNDAGGAQAYQSTRKGQTIYVYQKHHIRFGRLHTSIYTLHDCQQTCTDAESCKGFDFCQDDLSCWLHDQKSENMDMVQETPRCNHYMVWRQGDPKPQADMVKLSLRTQEFSPGGISIPGVMDFGKCQDLCITNRYYCHGFDFCSYDNKCIHHTATTECSYFIHNVTCNHYGLTDCKRPKYNIHPARKEPHSVGPKPNLASTKPAPTYHEPHQTAISSTTESSRVRTTPSFTYLPSMVKMKVSQQKHLNGGSLQEKAVDLQNCLRTCLSTGSCVGFDFCNSYDESNSCWIFDNSTECTGELEAIERCDHYNLHQCDNSETDEGTTPNPHGAGEQQRMHIELRRHTSVIGGFKVHVHSLESCQQSCLINSACVGFDFCTGSCWHHVEKSVCGHMIDNPKCDHYRFYNCDKTDPTEAAVLIPDPTSGFRVSYTNTLRPGGTEREGSFNLDECLTICLEDKTCIAVEYQEKEKGCLTHTGKTYCGIKEDHAGSTHYSKIPCFPYGAYDKHKVTEGKRGLAGTSHKHPMIGTIYGTKFPVFKAATRVEGGTLHSTGVSERDCMDTCSDDTDCFAVDYHDTFGSCWLHTVNSFCGKRYHHSYTFKHYARIPCKHDESGEKDLESSTEEITPSYSGFVYHIANTTVEGGELRKVGLKIWECRDLCQEDPMCFAVDFNHYYGACWVHGPDTFCGKLVPKVHVEHCRKMPCPSEEEAEEEEAEETTTRSEPTIVPTTLAATTPEPTEPYKLITFHQTVDYAYIPRGDLVASGCTEQECLGICKDDWMCFAVDYYYKDSGACFTHNATSYCVNTLDAEHFRHHKKVPCFPAPIEDNSHYKASQDEVHISVYDNANEYFTVELNGIYMNHGVFRSYNVSLDQCFNLCLHYEDCEGVDYYTPYGGACWLHYADTICGEETYHIDFVHYKKRPCAAESYFPIVKQNTFVDWGTLVDYGLTEKQCVQHCAHDKYCLAVDYFDHEKSGACWSHNITTYCRPSINNDRFTHYQKIPCLDELKTTKPPSTTPTTSTTTSTTTTATTTLPTTTTTEAKPQIYFPFVNEGLFRDWGHFVSSGLNQSECLGVCLRDSQCLGVDFYTGHGGACWTHNVTTYCGHQVANDEFTSYSKLPCLDDLKQEVTSEPEMTSEISGTTAAPPVTEAPSGPAQSFPFVVANTFSDWGSFVAYGVSVDECLQRCLDSEQCLAADYYTPLGGSCWHHSINTYCQQYVHNHNFTHYKKLPCLEDLKEVEQNSTETPVTPATEEGPKEYFPHLTYGAFVDWGAFVAHGISLDDCLTRCNGNEECLGVDYYKPLGGACWHHNVTTYCKPEVSHVDFDHYRKLPCLDRLKTTQKTTEEPTTTLPPNPIEMFPISEPGYFVDYGVLVNFTVTLEECLTLCLDDASCMGVDYYSPFGGACWSHNASTVCGERTKFPLITHYQREVCQEEEVTTATAPAPTSTLAPTKSPYEHFPVILNETFLDWGHFVDYYLSEAECLQECADDDNCLGADYYSLHGGACWVHNISTVCLPTMASPYFNHYQKAPCVPTLGAGGNRTEMHPPTTEAPQVSTPEPMGLAKYFPFTNSDKYALGGTFHSHHISSEECLYACHADKACLAVDYYGPYGGVCSFHNATSYCRPLRYHYGYVQHRKFPCFDQYKPTSTQPPTTETSSMTPHFTIPTTTTEPTTTTIPTTTPIPTTTTPIPTTTTPIPTTTTPIPTTTTPIPTTTTPIPTTTTPTTTTSATTMSTTTTANPGPVKYFSQVKHGLYMDWGSLKAHTLSQDKCLLLCLQDKKCVAVDYLRTLGGACFFHTASTYCRQEVRNYDFTHFKRLPCLGYHMKESETATPTPGYGSDKTTKPDQTHESNTEKDGEDQTLEGDGEKDFAKHEGFPLTYQGLYVDWGHFQQYGISEYGCLKLCHRDYDCIGVDYYRAYGGACWTHNVTTYCGTHVHNSDFVHHRRLPCLNKIKKPSQPYPHGFSHPHIVKPTDGHPYHRPTTTTAADTTQHHHYNHQVKTTSHSHYHPTKPTTTYTVNKIGYPYAVEEKGYFMDHGTFEQLNLTYSACKHLCASKHTCVAIDYFTPGGGACWTHTISTYCVAADKQRKYGFRHAKRMPCMSGTLWH